MKVLKFMGLIIIGLIFVWVSVYFVTLSYQHKSNEVKRVFEDLVNTNRGISKVKYSDRDFVIIELKDGCNIYNQLEISIKCSPSK